MPSSSKKRTAAKKQQQQRQPNIPLPTQETPLPPELAPFTSTPSQSAASASTQATLIDPNTPIVAFDFAFFIENANASSIHQFLDAASSTKDGKNLKLLFIHGAKEGRKWGYREGYHEGQEVGYDQGYLQGIEDGLDRSMEEMKETADDFASSRTEASTQTLPAASSQSSNVDVSAQTSPSLVDVDTQTPVPQDPPSSSPMPTLASSSYKPLTDSVSIERLVDLARDSPQDSELGIIWQHALEEGRKAGYAEGAKMVDGMQVSDVLKIGFEKGQVRGIVQERELWEMAGHSTSCFVTATSSTTTADAGTQVDCVTSLPPCTDTLVQTISTGIQTSPRSLVNADSHTSVITEPAPQVSRLDWAEDATSLPIAPLLPTPSVPRQHAPRDFSSLRSSRPNPFGSLQRRSKQSRPLVSSRFSWTVPFTRNLHPRYRPPPLRPRSSFPKPRVPAEASKKEPVIFSNLTPASSHISALDWDQDPRLSDLSRALKALGWIRP